MKDCIQIGRQHAIPSCGGQIGQESVLVPSGIVDEDIESMMLSGDFCDCTLPVFRLSDIQRDQATAGSMAGN